MLRKDKIWIGCHHPRALIKHDPLLLPDFADRAHSAHAGGPLLGASIWRPSRGLPSRGCGPVPLLRWPSLPHPGCWGCWHPRDPGGPMAALSRALRAPTHQEEIVSFAQAGASLFRPSGHPRTAGLRTVLPGAPAYLGMGGTSAASWELPLWGSVCGHRFAFRYTGNRAPQMTTGPRSLSLPPFSLSPPAPWNFPGPACSVLLSFQSPANPVVCAL